MKMIKIEMSEYDLLNIWSMCQLCVEALPDIHDDNDHRLIKELSDMYDALSEHTCEVQ